MILGYCGFYPNRLFSDNNPDKEFSENRLNIQYAGWEIKAFLIKKSSNPACGNFIPGIRYGGGTVAWLCRVTVRIGFSLLIDGCTVNPPLVS
jgi:hypothetical protein